jgi:uncharacterized protein YhbP (UPF0306 family)
MQLSTVVDSQPWICTVYFVIDNDFNIYWTYAKNRRHSKEIISQNNAAIAIVKDTERKQGMQITGKAFMISEEDVKRDNRLYIDKFGDKPKRLADVQANTTEGQAYWVFMPDIISLWDEVNFPNQPKQEYMVQ